MPPRLPVISGQDAVKAFTKAGFILLSDRGRGSHMVMHKPGNPAILTIPNHNELRRGTLRSLIRSAGLTVDQFVALI